MNGKEPNIACMHVFTEVVVTVTGVLEYSVHKSVNDTVGMMKPENNLSCMRMNREYSLILSRVK